MTLRTKWMDWASEEIRKDHGLFGCSVALAVMLSPPPDPIDGAMVKRTFTENDPKARESVCGWSLYLDVIESVYGFRLRRSFVKVGTDEKVGDPVGIPPKEEVDRIQRFMDTDVSSAEEIMNGSPGTCEYVTIMALDYFSHHWSKDKNTNDGEREGQRRIEKAIKIMRKKLEGIRDRGDCPICLGTRVVNERPCPGCGAKS